MPSASEFGRLFGLHPGAAVAGVPIDDVHIDRAAAERYVRYDFDVRLTFTVDASSPADAKRAGDALAAAVRKGGPVAGKPRVGLEASLPAPLRLYISPYGSPYGCRLVPREAVFTPRDDGTYTIEMKIRGITERRHDLPTLAEQTRAKRSAAAAAREDAVAHDPAFLQKFCVTTSRFATGKCPLCGEQTIGSKIARPHEVHAQGHTGGWAHVACLAGQQLGRRGDDGGAKRRRAAAA